MTTETSFKTLPNSKESEMMVLGCMLTNEHAFDIAAKLLENADFYHVEHKILFQVMRNAHKNNKPADVHLVCETLRRQDKLESIGGIGYVMTLAQYAGTSAHVEEYIDILKQHSNKRSIVELSIELQRKANSTEDIHKVMIFAQESLKLIERNKGSKDKFPMRFLNKFEENFLVVEPTKKSMLLEYVKSDGKSAGFLPQGIVAMLVGAGGVGKTHLLAQLAISIVTGTPFLDTFTTTKHCGPDNKGNVFLGLGENQYNDIHRLLFKATKHLRKTQPVLDNDNILFAASHRIVAFSFCGQQASFLENGKPSLYFREFKMRLEDITPPGGWALIILDPVSRLMGTDAETDNAVATQFIALLEELSMDLLGNPTILFAHHTNKSALQSGAHQNQSAARGSSALTDGVRWQCNYSKEQQGKGGPEIQSNIATLRMTKSNFTPHVEDIKTIKDTDGFIERLFDNQKENFQVNEEVDDDQPYKRNSSFSKGKK